MRGLSSSDVKKITLGAGVIGVIMVAVAVGSILNNPLWEESTRFLFLGIWLVLTGLLGLRARFRRHFKYFLISTAAGFLSGEKKEGTGDRAMVFFLLSLQYFLYLEYLEHVLDSQFRTGTGGFRLRGQ